jgi:hypothetical protein
LPVSYALSGALLRLDLKGQYEPKDIIEQFLAGLADPGCPKKVSLLVDVTRSVVLETRAAQEIRRIAEFLAPYRDRIGRCAVIAERDVHFGLGRVGSAYSEDVGVEAGVFRDLESALRWLGFQK